MSGPQKKGGRTFKDRCSEEGGVGGVEKALPERNAAP